MVIVPDYDPDPIATLRRRRASAESVDSGGQIFGDRHQGLPRELCDRRSTSTVCYNLNATRSVNGSGMSSEESSPLKMGSTKAKHSSKVAAGEEPTESPETTSSPCKKKSSANSKGRSPESQAEVKTVNKAEVKVESRATLTPKGNKKKSKHEEDHGDLRVKLDGTFNNTTTYSIRSPLYGRGGNGSDTAVTCGIDGYGRSGRKGHDDWSLEERQHGEEDTPRDIFGGKDDGGDTSSRDEDSEDSVVSTLKLHSIV